LGRWDPDAELSSSEGNEGIYRLLLAVDRRGRRGVKTMWKCEGTGGSTLPWGILESTDAFIEGLQDDEKRNWSGRARGKKDAKVSRGKNYRRLTGKVIKKRNSFLRPMVYGNWEKNSARAEGGDSARVAVRIHGRIRPRGLPAFRGLQQNVSVIRRSSCEGEYGRSQWG